MENELHGRTALITGASSGLGVHFAEELARRGADLVLVARRRERLEAAAADLASRFGVAAHPVAMDLEDPAAADGLYRRLQEPGVSVDILVNNAGFGAYGAFLDVPWEKTQSMIRVDVLALVGLTRRFLPDMVARGYGRLLHVASMAAYQPSPLYAAYGGAKAFVLNFGEALDHELAGTGVTSTVVSPGVTRTEFLNVAGQSPTLFQRLTMMDAKDVAAKGVRAMLRGRRSVVTGWVNSLLTWSVRLLPRRTVAATAERFMR
jgi:uncharacterized protein